MPVHFALPATGALRPIAPWHSHSIAPSPIAPRPLHWKGWTKASGLSSTRQTTPFAVYILHFTLHISPVTCSREGADFCRPRPQHLIISTLKPTPKSFRLKPKTEKLKLLEMVRGTQGHYQRKGPATRECRLLVAFTQATSDVNTQVANTIRGLLSTITPGTRIESNRLLGHEIPGR